MKFLIQILISTLAVLTTAYLLPGVHVDTVGTAIIVSVVLSFLNAVVKPILVIFTIPITLFTLGLFLVVINALMVMLADSLIQGFSVKSFWTALVFSIVLYIITAIFESISGKDDRNNKKRPY
jgi:putative membrane protein